MYNSVWAFEYSYFHHNTASCTEFSNLLTTYKEGHVKEKFVVSKQNMHLSICITHSIVMYVCHSERHGNFPYNDKITLVNIRVEVLCIYIHILQNSTSF